MTVWKWIVGEASVLMIGAVLRVGGRCWISTERARALNTAIIQVAIRAAGGSEQPRRA